MLKGISPLLTPELLKILAEMGHGDELVIGDCNFPAQSMGKRCVRCDGKGLGQGERPRIQRFAQDGGVHAQIVERLDAAIHAANRDDIDADFEAV